MKTSPIHSDIPAIQFANGSMAMDAADVADYNALNALGINFERNGTLRAMAQWAMDDQQGGVTQGSITTPVQFLQNWLPGFVKVMTAARKIDDIAGITTSGTWEDEEIVQGILEPIGNAVPYGDYTNIPLASYNNNFVRRTVVRFEKGMKVGALEEARASRIRVSTAAEKRSSAALSLEIQRNLIGFNGYNAGNNLTYGFLNDPGLPAYVTVPNGASGFSSWSKKTVLEIITDIQTAVAQLQNQSQDNINPEDVATTLALSTVSYAWLNSVSSLVANSARSWITQNYPKMRVVSAPQLNGANGGSNVFYLFADKIEDGSSDGGSTFIQVVPAKFQVLGVEKQSKAYIEDYTCATAGIMVKRPWAVVRYSGI